MKGKNSGRPRGRKVNRDTAARKAKFLEVLRETGNMALAAREASPHLDHTKPTSGLSTFRTWMANDIQFAESVDDARMEAASKLVEELRRRGHDGWEEPVYQRGAPVLNLDGTPATIRRYSDKLLLALVKASLPEAFGDQRRHMHTHSFKGLSGFTLLRQDVAALSDQQQGQLKGIIQTIKASRAELVNADEDNEDRAPRMLESPPQEVS